MLQAVLGLDAARIAGAFLIPSEDDGATPTVGTRTGYAAAIAEASGLEAGLAVLYAIASDPISSHQPYWSARPHMLQWFGKVPGALDAYDRAIRLAEDPAVREFLVQKRLQNCLS